MIKVTIHPMGGAPELWVGSIISPKDGIGYCVSGSKDWVMEHYQEHFPFLEVEDITEFYKGVCREGDRIRIEMRVERAHEAELNREYMRFLEERDKQLIGGKE